MPAQIDSYILKALYLPALMSHRNDLPTRYKLSSEFHHPHLFSWLYIYLAAQFRTASY